MFTINLNSPVRVSFQHTAPIKPHTIKKALTNNRELTYFTPGCNGGTTCFIRLGLEFVESTKLFYGESICIPTDNLNKPLGRKLALTRALEQTELEAKDRQAIWNKYFSMARD